MNQVQRRIITLWRGSSKDMNATLGANRESSAIQSCPQHRRLRFMK